MGINFNDLSPQVQAKIQPFLTVAGSVENAIDAAVASGKMEKSEADALKNGLSGDKNWGRMDEYAFDSSKAEQYKSELPKAEEQNQLAQARKRNARKQAVESAVQEKFENLAEQQKELDKKRYELSKSIVDKRSQGVLGYLSAVPDRIRLDMTPEKAGEHKAGNKALQFFTSAAFALVAVALTDCTKFEEEDVKTINVNVSQPVKITFNFDFASVLAEMRGLRNDLKGYDQNAADRYIAILERLDAIKNNGELTNFDLNTLIKDLNDWMDVVTKNQIDIKTDNNQNFEDLFALLRTAMEIAKTDYNRAYNMLVEALSHIISIGQTISAKMDIIIEQLGKALDNDEEIIKCLKKLDKNDENIYAVLVGISNAINALGQKFAPYFKQIIAGISENNIKADQANALLAQINKNTEEIKALLTKYGNEGVNLGNAILNAIKNMPNVDLSGVEALLSSISNKQTVTNDKITNLTDLFNKYGEGVNNKLNKIISLLKNLPNYDTKLNTIINAIGNIKVGSEKDYEAQLNKIIELLKQLDKNNDTRNQKVLDAISKLGVDVSTSLTAILDAIKNIPAAEATDYTAALNAILDKIKEGNEANNKNFKAVIDAIAKLGPSITVGMNAILEAIKNLPDYTAKLDKIISKLNALGQKAQEILEAIKDHDVKITVDVTGKVSCECNCHCPDNGVHEGVLDDLTDLLG